MAESTGEEVKRRRKALRLSLEALGDKIGVHRNTLGKIEHDDDTVEAGTIRTVLDGLTKLERRYGYEQPDKVVNVIELPDGTRIVFEGSPESVADAATRFLSRHTSE